MRIFTYKLAACLSTGDVADLQNAWFRGSCRVSRVSWESLGRIGLFSCFFVVYRVRATARAMVSFWLYVTS